MDELPSLCYLLLDLIFIAINNGLIKHLDIKKFSFVTEFPKTVEWNKWVRFLTLRLQFIENAHDSLVICINYLHDTAHILL